MNVDEALTIETSEQTAQDALVALQIEVERLRAMEQRARDTLSVAWAHPASVATARRILGLPQEA